MVSHGAGGRRGCRRRGFPVQGEECVVTYRMLALFVAALAFTLLAGAGGLAADEKTHDGMVVKAGDGKLTMTDKDGKNEHTHMVARDAKITCDGKECKLDDLQ